MKEFKYTINGNVYNVKINEIEDSIADVEVNGTSYKVEMEKSERKVAPVKSPTAAVSTPAETPVAPPPPTPAAPPASAKPTTAAKPTVTGSGSLKAPLPGIVLSVDCKVGDTVKKGQKLLVLEAMKMENVIPADRDGEIADIKINKGDAVLEGVDIIIFK